MGEEKRNVLFARIQTRDDALRTIKSASLGFLLIAAIGVALGFLLTPRLIIDGVVFAILALILMKWKSRVGR